MDGTTKKKTVRGALGINRFFIKKGRNNDGDLCWVVWERTGFAETRIRGMWTNRQKAKNHVKRLYGDIK